MITLINYFLEANLGLLLFAAGYRLLLHGEQKFSVNRIFLVSGILASLTFPLIQLAPSNFIPGLSISKGILPTYGLPGVTIGAIPSRPELVPFLSFWTVVRLTYLLVSSSLAVIFTVRLFRIMGLYLRSKTYHWKNCIVAESTMIRPTFSFFHFIFIGQADHLTTLEKESILSHERVHVQRVHSLDVVLVNLLLIAFWFNPIVWYFRNTLVQLHEYEADELATRALDTEAYCHLLAKVALRSGGLSLVNHFNQHLTLKRIAMINTLKKKMPEWKLIPLMASFALYFFVTSCQEQPVTDLRVMSVDGSNATSLPSDVHNVLDQLQRDNPGKGYDVLFVNGQGEKAINILMTSIRNNPVYALSMHVSLIKNGSDTYCIIDKIRPLGSSTAASDSTFTVVDHQPMFKGGYDSLIHYVQSHLKYPADAQKAGIEGKVFVSFVVQKDGKVADVTMVKGVREDIDQAALRVMRESPPWVPGQNEGQIVNARFMMPINFVMSK